MECLKIKPLDVPDYTVKQSPHYPRVMKCPWRTAVVGNTSCGKTTVCVRILADLFRDTFERLYIVSQSVHLDPSYAPLINLMKAKGYDPAEHIIDRFDEDWIETNVIQPQMAVAAYQKTKNPKGTQIYQVCLWLDDVADDPALRNSNLLSTIAMRSRHYGLNILYSLQRWKAIHPQVRNGLSDLLIFKQKSREELEGILTSISCLAKSKDDLEALYRDITSEKFAFMWVALNRDGADTLHRGFGPGLSIKTLK